MTMSSNQLKATSCCYSVSKLYYAVGNPDFSESEAIDHHGVKVDKRRFVVTLNDAPLKLTKSEFQLLETLIRQPGRAFSRSQLVEAALGEDTMVLERTIDVHIRALRRKMGESADLIETVRGIGYRFKE